MAVSFENRAQEMYLQQALQDVQAEHGNYFAALEQHPRLLVGREVPAIGRDGMETLRDTDDAREWQEAVKSILLEEAKDRARRSLDENKDFLATIHSSIALFQNNTDLIPGTKGFDVALANRLVQLVQPYELRVDGKLQGYSIDVQPIVNQLRAQLAAERTPAAAPAPASAQSHGSAPGAGAASSQAGPATPPAQPADPPQVGISSKPGNSAEAAEDFSTLFGTLGLPNLRI